MVANLPSRLVSFASLSSSHREISHDFAWHGFCTLTKYAWRYLLHDEAPLGIGSQMTQYSCPFHFFQVVPAMLPLVASEAHSPELRAAATDIMLRCFKSDPQGLSMFVKMHESSIKGSIQVVDALSARWSSLRVPKVLQYPHNSSSLFPRD